MIDYCFFATLPSGLANGTFPSRIWREFDLKLGLIPSLSWLQAWWPGGGIGGVTADCFSALTLGRKKRPLGFVHASPFPCGLFKKTLLLKNNK